MAKRLADDGSPEVVSRRPLRASTAAYLRDCLDVACGFVEYVERTTEDGNRVRERVLGAEDRFIPAHLLRLDLEAGRMWTYLPNYVDDEIAHRLGDSFSPRDPTKAWSTPDGGKSWYRGGVQITNVADVMDALRAISPIEEAMIRLVQDYLASDASACCVSDEILLSVANATRSVERRMAPYLFFHRAEVCSCLPQGGADPMTVRRLLRGIPDMWQAALLTRLAGRPMIQPTEEVTDARMREIVDGMEMFLMRAYDGDGWIIWGRPGTGHSASKDA